MPRPIAAIIHRRALRHNLHVVAQRAGARKVWAVIKANAYGHGLERVLPAFAAADALALLDLAEAERARAAGWRKPIVLLEGFFEARDLVDVERLQLTAVVHSGEQIDWLSAWCRDGSHDPRRAARGAASEVGDESSAASGGAAASAALSVIVKFNTGMQRLGFGARDADAALARLLALPRVRLEAAMMHFANSDATNESSAAVSVQEQLEQFAALTRHWAGARSLANSAALFTQPAVRGESVRPGIALYGGTPIVGTSATAFDLQAAMTLQAQILSIQSVAAHSAVGYGSRWRAPRASRIAVVACGYADGYPRLAPDGTPVAIAGQRAQLVGRVSMDMITVDITDLPQAEVGTAVELWGTNIPIDEVAERAGTVGYELMCALAARVPVVVDE